MDLLQAFRELYQVVLAGNAPMLGTSAFLLSRYLHSSQSGRSNSCWGLIIWPLTTLVIFVASCLEKMTSCEESQQNDKEYQGDRWDDGHAKSLSRRPTLTIRCSVDAQNGLAVQFAEAAGCCVTPNACAVSLYDSSTSCRGSARLDVWK